ncbi:MAG TPA: hypothetical protein VFC84_05255, partial [Desulfosporosinus sp.]|nr:hypothetical protein [Desulfosporosinus sp.]
MVTGKTIQKLSGIFACSASGILEENDRWVFKLTGPMQPEVRFARGNVLLKLSVLKRDKPASSKACLVVYIATVYYLTFLGGEIKSKKILVPSASYFT